MASPSFGSPYHSVKFHDLVETVEDWRLLVLGMWVEERLRRSRSLDLPWLYLARAQTLEFDRCQSWSLTSVALGYEPADADWPMLLRFKSWTPLSSLRSMPVVSLVDGMLGSRKRVASLGVGDHVWRRRVVTQWLRTGRAVLLALRVSELEPNPTDVTINPTGMAKSTLLHLSTRSFTCEVYFPGLADRLPRRWVAFWYRHVLPRPGPDVQPQVNVSFQNRDSPDLREVMALCGGQMNRLSCKGIHGKDDVQTGNIHMRRSGQCVLPSS